MTDRDFEIAEYERDIAHDEGLLAINPEPAYQEKFKSRIARGKARLVELRPLSGSATP